MSLKKIFYFIIIALIHVANAGTETCPTVQELISNQLIYFIPLYVDNEELAMPADVQKFKNHLTHFVKATWDRNYAEYAHCFYTGTDPMVNKIIYANDAYKPIQNENWQWLHASAAECVTSPETCAFIM